MREAPTAHLSHGGSVHLLVEVLQVRARLPQLHHLPAAFAGAGRERQASFGRRPIAYGAPHHCPLLSRPLGEERETQQRHAPTLVLWTNRTRSGMTARIGSRVCLRDDRSVINGAGTDHARDVVTSPKRVAGVVLTLGAIVVAAAWLELGPAWALVAAAVSGLAVLIVFWVTPTVVFEVATP